MTTKAQLIYILGDIHGDWPRLNAFINRHVRQSKAVRRQAAHYADFEVIILQCGDFGYWPHTEPQHSFFAPDCLEGDGEAYAVKNHVPFLKDEMVKIYWCAGNHENHDALDELENLHPDLDFIPVQPGVYFARFGAVLTLLEGTNVLFCGGAASGDAHKRVPGTEWWPQEVISEESMLRLPPEDTRVDWVISHTSPASFVMPQAKVHIKNQDISRLYLEEIRKRFKPSAWWHGHYHIYATGMFEGCRWTSLDYLGHGQRYHELKLVSSYKEP